MTDTTANEAIISRIQKLLALQRDKGATEGEQANAAAAIQTLLSKHNLEMAAVEAAAAQRGEASTVDSTGGPRAKTTHQASAMYKYQRILMEALARNNFCMYFLDEEQAQSFGKMRRVKRHVLLGRKVNVVTSQITYDYLVETMDRLLPYTGMEKRGRDALAWLDGCSERLVARLDDLRHSAEEESKEKARQEKARQSHPAYAGSGQALVVLSDVYGSEAELNQDALYGLAPGTTARRRIEAAEARAKAAQEAKERQDAYKLAHPDASSDRLYLIGMGYSEERAAQIESDWEKDRKKQSRSRSRSYSSGYRYSAREAREDERRASPAYRAGASSGEKISLNRQVGDGKDSKLGKE